MRFEHLYRFMNFRIFMVIVLFLCLTILHVEAGIRVVPPGGTVFIGEEQLDISACGIGSGGQIAWWAPGTSVKDSPADVVTVSNPSSFSVLSSSFSEHEGIWYSLADKTPIIKIKQPRISLRVSDTTADFDATGKWIPRGDVVSFEIETNLYEIGNRGDGAGVPVNIIIKSPQGSDYSAVSGPSGSFSLSGIPVRSSSYDSGPVWYTGDADIGKYDIHAECTANRINDNNGEPGAAVSQTVSVLIQGVNPLITSGKGEEETTVPTGTVTGTPLVPSPVPKESVPVPSITLPVTPEPVASAGSNQTNATPSPSPSLAVLTTAPPVPVTSMASPLPTPTPRTSFPWLLAILAVAGVMFRVSR